MMQPRPSRALSLSRATWLVVVTALAAGCNAIFGIEGHAYDPGAEPARAGATAADGGGESSAGGDARGGVSGIGGEGGGSTAEASCRNVPAALHPAGQLRSTLPSGWQQGTYTGSDASSTIVPTRPEPSEPPFADPLSSCLCVEGSVGATSAAYTWVQYTYPTPQHFTALSIELLGARGDLRLLVLPPDSDCQYYRTLTAADAGATTPQTLQVSSASFLPSESESCDGAAPLDDGAGAELRAIGFQYNGAEVAAPFAYCVLGIEITN